MEYRDTGSPRTCPRCGAPVPGGVNFCPHCGAPLSGYGYASAAPRTPYISPCNRLVALLLCIFVGYLGAHRFYVGKIGTGILWLLTGGCLGIGVLVDLIMICTGSFTDQYGRYVLDWNGVR